MTPTMRGLDLLFPPTPLWIGPLPRVWERGRRSTPTMGGLDLLFSPTSSMDRAEVGLVVGDVKLDQHHCKSTRLGLL